MFYFESVLVSVINLCEMCGTIIFCVLAIGGNRALSLHDMSVFFELRNGNDYTL